MIETEHIHVLRQHVNTWKQQGKSLALVPTMGNLHQGHIALLNEAHRHADRVIVSLFVNPIQFDKKTDLNNYPRTYEKDKEALKLAGCDLVFSPTAETMYGATQASTQKMPTRVQVNHLGDILEGASRAGHFSGVATVVTKLFNLATPDFAIFGEKDFQQLMVIRQMVEDLNFNIKIISHPIVREKDNLAMSSRNGYLTPEERRVAPYLNKAINEIKKRILEGEKDYQSLCRDASSYIAEQGFKPDYIEVRRQQDLEVPEQNTRNLVIVASAWLGKARLLDNVAFSL